MTEDKEKMLLESIIGTSVSRTAGVQIPIDTKLPFDFPQNAIHYELYQHHIELHIESSNYKSLCYYLHQKLPNNETSKECDRGFCKFAYVLNQEVKGWSDIVELGNAINELRNIVEPVMLSYCHQLMENLVLAKDLADYYEKQKENSPFHINIIDELHANENAHSRILTKLLKYKTDGSYVILSSFLSLLSNFNESIDDINSSSVYFNRDFIDCLVECPKKFAVIVENKIHNAVDQNKQIERYVTNEINKGIPKNKIWVIYLTSDGSKTVDNHSLTIDVQNILTDRFVTMDYRNHILPWLKDSILPNCKLREDWLISALKQYVDHLEGIFGIRLTQSELREKMEKKIIDILGIKNMSISNKYSQLREFTDKVESLRNMLETTSSGMVKTVIEKLQNTTREVLAETDIVQKIEFHDGTAGNYFQLFVNGWNHSVHFEWIPLNHRQLMCDTDYCLVVHIEDQNLATSTNEILVSDDAIATEGQTIGFKKCEQRTRTYYKKELHAEKPIAEMTHDELVDFLKKIYYDVPKLIEFMEKYILEKS